MQSVKVFKCHLIVSVVFFARFMVRGFDLKNKVNQLRENQMFTLSSTKKRINQYKKYIR